MVLLAGGDVELGRGMGKALLRDPSLDPLATLAPWLRGADLRFVNLEGPLSDQRGETMSPRNPLVFTGPPAGAEALARASIDVVSTANNHAWDYGKAALLETLTHLDRAGVRHAGTGPDLESAWRPVIVEKKGLRVAFLAVTDLWNQGLLRAHEGRAFVADAGDERLEGAVRQARGEADVVVVSYHGGDEYQPAPLPRARALHRRLIEAGADLILGHHPHVLQGIEWHRERPIFHSLGNLLMRMHRDHPWTGLSLMARVRLAPPAAPAVELCPFEIVGIEPRPLAPESASWARFAAHLRALQAHTSPGALGAAGPDGCAPFTRR